LSFRFDFWTCFECWEGQCQEQRKIRSHFRESILLDEALNVQPEKLYSTSFEKSILSFRLAECENKNFRCSFQSESFNWQCCLLSIPLWNF
jgi:hypothetical protein